MQQHVITKNDYAYIGLLDDELTNFITNLQRQLGQEWGIIKFANQWAPHCTLCYGNILTEDEYVCVQNTIDRIIKATCPIHIELGQPILLRKQTIAGISNVFQIPIIIHDELVHTFHQLQSVADRYETPYRGFTGERFHITVAAYDIPDDFVIPSIAYPTKGEIRTIVIHKTR